MYQPPHFREDRLEIQHELIRTHPLGLLITLGSEGLVANPIPFALDATGPACGTLKGHLARGNRQWRDFDSQHEALVVFQGPAAYVTPSWYATKRETAKVVPTWNYAIVQAYGPLKVHDDAEWLARQIRHLTESREALRAEPWRVDDAPADFIAAQLKGIVGIEIPISRIEGKWKVSQNRTASDRAGVIEGLNSQGDTISIAMADLVRERGG